MKHPIQPIIKDASGTARFKENKIVSFLAEGKLNELARIPFDKEDRQQLAQLIGYSLSGYSELGYVDDDAYGAAEKMKDGTDERDARIAHLESELAAIRSALQEPMARLFGVHPDDLGRNLS